MKLKKKTSMEPPPGADEFKEVKNTRDFFLVSDKNRKEQLLPEPLESKIHVIAEDISM